MRTPSFILICIAFLFLNCGKRGESRFAEFPIEKTLTVNFNFPNLAQEEFSDREKADQAKDWLLFSLISNSGLKGKEVAEATFDLAPVRYGFNSTLANFDYGDTRSKFIGEGELVALIPVSDEKTRKDNIAHILDETRKNQGEKPKKAYVFEYDLNTEGKFAKLTRKEDIDASSFFTDEMGYFESTISNLEDLKSFMDKTDDVTYAKREDNNLIFGGRKLFSRTYGKVTVEDIAALWQSEKYIQEKQVERQSTESNFEADYKEKTNDVYKKYNDLLETIEFKDGSSFSGLSIEDKNELIDFIVSTAGREGETLEVNSSIYKSEKSVTDLILKLKADLKLIDDEFAAKAKTDFKEATVASASGFSLDPDVNFEKSIEFVNKYKYFFQEALEPEFTVDQLIHQLKQRNGDLMQYAIAKVGKGLGGLLGLSKEARETCLYQKARYDGKLQGTSVGMTLFYTDLLAKMWAANMFNSHPDVNITGFKDLEQTSIVMPVVFEKESSYLPACRLWFGPNKNGFQLADGKKALTFARNATQIFALSNNPLDSAGITKEGKSKNLEVQASDNFEVVLNWWNNHYEEVGQFEPQYERLNEIMKWSTVIGWLNSEYPDNSLDFLNPYHVNYNSWFPDWVKSTPNLKFNDWDKLAFYERGSFGNTSETIPLLYSFNTMFSGGVSLADKSLLKEAPELLTGEKSLFRRANIAEDFTDGQSGGFKTFKETKINLVENVEAQTTSIGFTPKEGYKLRNRFGEIENTKFQWEISEDPAGNFSVQSKFNNTAIGELRSTSVGENGFSVGFESQALDKGMSLGRQCSDFSGDLNSLLRSHPEVSRYFQTESGEWYVEMKGSKEWMLMKVNREDAEGTVNLANGWQARTSGSNSNSKIVEMKWVRETDIPKAERITVSPVDILDEAPDVLRKRLIEAKGRDAANLELKQLQIDGTTKAEELASKGDYEKAALQTEKLIQHFGESADLVAKRISYEFQAGLKAIENNNLNTAANYLNEAITKRPASLNSNDILDNINGFLERSNISSEVKYKINELANAYFTDKQLFIPGYWEGYKPLAREVPIDAALSKNGAKIIYSDNASFSNIDFGASYETIMGQIKAIPGVQVYDISAEAIGKNTRMYASVEPNISEMVKHGQSGPNFRFRVSPGSSLNNCIDQDNDGKCDNEYTVKGSVYYVTAPSLN